METILSEILIESMERLSLLALALHPFSASTLSDGVQKACLAQTLHPISVLTESDGVKKLVEYKLYILLRLQPYPMVCEDKLLQLI